MGVEYQTGFLLNRASWAMSRYLKSHLRAHGLKEVSVGFIGVLLALAQRDGLRLTELGQAVSLEKSTMTGLIDRMERARLVRRRASPNDRRAFRICLTERGRAIAPEVQRVLKQAYRELTRGMNAEELEQVRASLVQLIRNAYRRERSRRKKP